jgi:hypothetical protein
MSGPSPLASEYDGALWPSVDGQATPTSVGVPVPVASGAAVSAS